MKKRLIKGKNKGKIIFKLVKPNNPKTIKKGDIDEYIYSWQDIRRVSER